MVNPMHSKVKLGDFNPAIGFDRQASSTKMAVWYIIKMVFFLSAFPFPGKLKVILLRIFGAKIGSGLVIKPRVNIHFPWKLVLGNNVWLGEEVFILNFERVEIGNNVCISQRSFLCGGNHDFRIPSFPYRNGPITLNDGAWVGACAFIGPGVTIGIDSIVMAGSFAFSDLEPNGIFRGNPAVFVKKRWID